MRSGLYIVLGISIGCGKITTRVDGFAPTPDALGLAEDCPIGLLYASTWQGDLSNEQHYREGWLALINKTAGPIPFSNAWTLPAVIATDTTSQKVLVSLPSLLDSSSRLVSRENTIIAHLDSDVEEMLIPPSLLDRLYHPAPPDPEQDPEEPIDLVLVEGDLLGLSIATTMPVDKPVSIEFRLWIAPWEFDGTMRLLPGTGELLPVEKEVVCGQKIDG